MARMSESGIPIEGVYGPKDVQNLDPVTDLGEPGSFPFTRGVYPTMYATRPWTMRQYAGFSTAAESNRRYHQLIEAGTTGLSVAFDLPTQMGYDSDAPQARGEVGKVGVAIDSLADMRLLFDGIRLDQVSTSMTINAPAALLLLLYQLVAEEQGVDPAALTGTIQNDILKEYIARGTYIYPPQPSLRLVADTFAYCRAEIPRWNTISISGYHMAEAGATPVQEIAFTLANAREYVRAALAAGMAVDEFAPRLSFFFVARTTLLEEVAKFRAARRLWAHIMREEFGAQDPRSQMLRFHTQTAGVQLTAQQPEVNLARVTLQALAAVLGGTQSLHTNSYDEAIALPSQKAATLALRTQQVLAYETDLTSTADPLAGSYAIESMTDEVEAGARELMARVDDLGGAVAAIDQGFQKAEIERSAYQIARQVDSGERVVVGVNKFVSKSEEPYEPLRVNPAIEQEQAARLARLRQERHAGEVRRRLDEIKRAAAAAGASLAEAERAGSASGLAAPGSAGSGAPGVGPADAGAGSGAVAAGAGGNLLYPLREALRSMATIGEVCDALRDVWGVYRPPEVY
ncbi:MAG TPA: methylmalonyl-CoA mutase family protein [Streptosporangiaceae bacterium]